MQWATRSGSGTMLLIGVTDQGNVAEAAAVLTQVGAAAGTVWSAGLTKAS